LQFDLCLSLDIQSMNWLMVSRSHFKHAVPLEQDPNSSSMASNCIQKFYTKHIREGQSIQLNTGLGQCEVLGLFLG